MKTKNAKSAPTSSADEGVRRDSTLKNSSVEAVFAQGGSVGGERFPSIGGAAFVLVVSERMLKLNVDPIARLADYHVKVEPHRRSAQSIPRHWKSRHLCTGPRCRGIERSLRLAIGCGGETGLDPAMINPNRGAIALGHRRGAPARSGLAMMHELRSRQSITAW